MQATLTRVETIREHLAELDGRAARCEASDPARAATYREMAAGLRAELARLVERD